MFTAEQAAAGVFFVFKTRLFCKGAFWGPPALLTAEQAAAGAFSFEQKKRAFFWKGVFWSPQAMFTAEQAAAGCFFFEQRHAILKKVRFDKYLVNID